MKSTFTPPDKSRGHRRQKIDIYFRFRAASAATILDKQNYGNRKSCEVLDYTTFERSSLKLL